ncbi:Hypothetical predicted protein [Podarcis lilfordi]|uniref:Uncharacterized protein n=1 Tax=Podarcis lilfordi TaxID=74358 RepID=A0AA35LD78_9SAUR|nr:Hypothetical predicted protein [Podarcis lilfordi]
MGEVGGSEKRPRNLASPSSLHHIVSERSSAQPIEPSPLSWEAVLKHSSTNKQPICQRKGLGSTQPSLGPDGAERQGLRLDL